MQTRRVLFLTLILTLVFGIVGCSTPDSDKSLPSQNTDQESSISEMPQLNGSSKEDAIGNSLTYNLYCTDAFGGSGSLVTSFTFPEDERYRLSGNNVTPMFLAQSVDDPLALIGLDCTEENSMNSTEFRPFLLNLGTGELQDYGLDNNQYLHTFRKAVMTQEYIYPMCSGAERDTSQTLRYTYYRLDTLEPITAVFQFPVPQHFIETNGREEYFGVCHNEDNGDWYVFYRSDRWGPGENPASHEQAYRDYDLNCVIFDADGNVKSDSQTGLTWPIGAGSSYIGRFIVNDDKIFFSYVSQWGPDDENAIQNPHMFDVQELSIAEYDPYANSTRMIIRYTNPNNTRMVTSHAGANSMYPYYDTFMMVCSVDENGVKIDIPSDNAIIRRTVGMDGRESALVGIRPANLEYGNIYTGNSDGGGYYYICPANSEYSE